MKEDQDDLARSTRQPLPAFDTNPFEKQISESEPQDNSPADWQDNDSHYFSSLDEDLDPTYEETDRDTDFAPALREDSVDALAEDENFDELLPEDLESDDESLFAEQEAFLQSEASDLLAETQNNSDGFWSTVDDLDKPWPDDLKLDQPQEQTAAGLNSDNNWEKDYDEPESGALWLGAAAAEGNETSQSTDDDQWYDDDEYGDDEFEPERWPISLIVIGTLALLLVVAGVYGIVQDRSATQDQIRQLQASLATAVSPDEVDASRTALQEANERSRTLSAQVSQLRAENQRLTDTVAGLEAQVDALEQAPPPIAAKPAAPQAAPTAKPAAKKTEPPAATTAAATGWFVNFGSYGEETIAKNWADKLAKDFGSVIVAPSSKDGRTYYRVRVIGLGSRDAAENTARKLESAYDLPKLWVGRQ